ncbi:MAG: transposase family protein, partial [Firmicutes bacterium]|nr:transposase family protein [Bacillota bacterium]
MSKREEWLIRKQQAQESKLQQLRAAGIAFKVKYEKKPKKQSIPNRLSDLTTPEEEKEECQETVEATLKVYRQLLPGLLCRLKHIEDPRNPVKIKHKLTVLMVYGILFFVYQVSSRREANREMSKPIFYENLKAMFPELETLPHADTLARLLERIKDCERKAFYRLAEKIKKRFPRLKIAVVLDGLYACGPVIRLCRQYKWDYMIVLKEDALKEVWREATGLMRLEPKNTLTCVWGDRIQ